METNYKRQYRQIDDITKQKISQALRGRTKSATPCTIHIRWT